MELLEKNSKEKAHQYVERVLSHNIFNWNLKPGFQLDEIELSSIFGFSRTPIREALIVLSKNKLVDIYPQRGTYVSLLDISLIRQAQYLRQLVEPNLSARACEIYNEQMCDKLRENIVLMECYANDRKGRQFACDLQFHKLIYQICGMDFLFEVISSASVHLNRMRYLCLFDGGFISTITDHQKIIEAIGKKNPEMAKSAMLLHLSTTLDDLEELLKKYPEYFLA